jgi:hypothetical protein
MAVREGGLDARHNRRDPIFRYRRHEDQIIVLAVRWYISYRLSLRDLVEMLADRGLDVHPSTIWRWMSATSSRRQGMAMQRPSLRSAIMARRRFNAAFSVLSCSDKKALYQQESICV